jgi:hypothetical protein
VVALEGDLTKSRIAVFLARRDGGGTFPLDMAFTADREERLTFP